VDTELRITGVSEYLHREYFITGVYTNYPRLRNGNSQFNMKKNKICRPIVEKNHNLNCSDSVLFCCYL